MARKTGKPDPLGELTWGDLEAWAGSRTVKRAQSYQKGGKVEELARTPGGGLVAWVRGQKRYATQVEWQGDKLASTCSCPMGRACKHAVAVVLAGLEPLREKRSLPTVGEADPRLRLLSGAPGDDEEDQPPVAGRRPKARRRSSRASLHAFLEEQTKEWLISFLEELGAGDPAVRRAIEDRHRLARGVVDEMVQAVRDDLEALPDEPDGRGFWGRRGSAPAYSAVGERLTALLERGYADALVDLGSEVLQVGSRQVEMTEDDSVSWAISSWMDAVFRALPLSSRPPADQMLLALEWHLADDYGLCEGIDAFWKKRRPAAVWGALAEELGKRLKRATEGGYRRDRTVDFLIEALEKGGRKAEVIPWCEREIEATGNYLRLVERLVAAGRADEAEQWIRRGVAATQEKAMGTAERLREAWCRQREAAKDWLGVATFHAEKLFAEPSLETLQALLKAAERARIGPTVRSAALVYLETGKLPQTAASPGKSSAWPLPPSGLAARKGRLPPTFPCFETLIALAIAEKRPNEVLRWHDHAGRKRALGWGAEVSEDRIAEAVAATHPERALGIWKVLAEFQIGVTSPRAYEVAAGFLRKVKRLLESLNRAGEWKTYAATLRTTHARKRRFVESLDGLEKAGRRIRERGS